MSFSSGEDLGLRHNQMIGPGAPSAINSSPSMGRCSGYDFWGSFMSLGKYFRLSAMAVAALTFLSLSNAPVQAGDSQPQDVASPVGTGTYHLDVGDKVKVTVYGESDLSGDFQIDGAGNVGMPMIGDVHAAGMTTADFATTVQNKLKTGHFLINPRVSAEVTNYRPFTILGEVNKPGEYPYENGMSVLNAVALAGGWTYRANESTVYVRHKGATREEAVGADEKSLINPGDTVRVVERIF